MSAEIKIPAAIHGDWYMSLATLEQILSEGEDEAVHLMDMFSELKSMEFIMGRDEIMGQVQTLQMVSGMMYVEVQEDSLVSYHKEDPDADFIEDAAKPTELTLGEQPGHGSIALVADGDDTRVDFTPERLSIVNLVSGAQIEFERAPLDLVGMYDGIEASSEVEDMFSEIDEMMKAEAEGSE